MEKLHLSEEEIFDKLKKSLQVFAKNNEKQFGKIERASDLRDDLGLDSLDCVELVIHIEEDFKVNISSDMNAYQSVDDIIRYLEIALKDAGD